MYKVESVRLKDGSKDVDDFRRVMAESRTVDTEANQGEKEEIQEASWGRAKANGCTHGICGDHICVTDRVSLEGLAPGVWQFQFSAPVFSGMEEKGSIQALVAAGTGGI